MFRRCVNRFISNSGNKQCAFALTFSFSFWKTPFLVHMHIQFIWAKSKRKACALCTRERKSTILCFHSHAAFQFAICISSTSSVDRVRHVNGRFFSQWHTLIDGAIKWSEVIAIDFTAHIPVAWLSFWFPFISWFLLFLLALIQWADFSQFFLSTFTSRTITDKSMQCNRYSLSVLQLACTECFALLSQAQWW